MAEAEQSGRLQAMATGVCKRLGERGDIVDVLEA